MKKAVPAIALAMTLSGCATVFDGSNQDFVVNTVGDKDPNDTRCTIVNEEGSWKGLPNSTMSIHRDGNQMTIDCENDTQEGVATLDPRFQAEWLLLDILWDACILTASCIIDGVNNAFYEYPSSVSVDMQDKVVAKPEEQAAAAQ